MVLDETSPLVEPQGSLARSRLLTDTPASLIVHCSSAVNHRSGRDCHSRFWKRTKSRRNAYTGFIRANPDTRGWPDFPATLAYRERDALLWPSENARHHALTSPWYSGRRLVEPHGSHASGRADTVHCGSPNRGRSRPAIRKAGGEKSLRPRSGSNWDRCKPAFP